MSTIDLIGASANGPLSAESCCASPGSVMLAVR